ncbi:MAG TPA: 50S ribosomal protein L4 [Chlamydiales bacterium]|nr:50S ribosomal protein L4 [Chlamydiales bacterium]
MATLKKFNLTGTEVGSLQIEDALLEVSAHSQSMKDYIVAIRNNARQWSACTKRRSEVNHTGRKPHPQKGQGRSRQGDLAAPHYKGGAVVWGPRPKDVHTRINKKERRAAIRFLLAEKIKDNRVRVLQKEEMSEPKTKAMVEFLEKLALKDRRILLIGSTSSSQDPSRINLAKSLRNIPKKEYLPLAQVNGYELARSQEIVLLESAMEELISLLGPENRKAI